MEFHTLSSTTEAELQQLFNRNKETGMRRIHIAAGATEATVSGIPVWIATDPMHNGTEHAPVGSGAAAADEAVQSVQSFFRPRGVGVRWVVGPIPQPELEASLLAHGFELDEGEPTMAASLETYDPAAYSALIESIAGFEIVDVDALGVSGTREWITAWGCGTTPEPVMERWRQIYDILLQGPPRSEFTMFVGRVKGQTVGTGILYCSDGVAAVHFIVTIPEFRKRGIGKALTMHAMKLASASGYKIAMLTASDFGIRIYKSLGFREFGRQVTYKWDL